VALGGGQVTLAQRGLRLDRVDQGVPGRRAGDGGPAVQDLAPGGGLVRTVQVDQGGERHEHRLDQCAVEPRPLQHLLRDADRVLGGRLADRRDERGGGL
jgi:hypothetical protein